MAIMPRDMGGLLTGDAGKVVLLLTGEVPQAQPFQ
jgi:hypothetical protein